MGDDRPEPPLARQDVERGAAFGDGHELLGTCPGQEVMTEGEGLDGIAGLAGNDEQRTREVGCLPRRADRGRVGAVQYVESARAERLGEHVGDEARPAHATHQRAIQPVRVNGRRERGVLIPQRE